MSNFADKVRSIGTSFHKGRSRDHRVVDERDGSTAGKHVEHWDGRQDAVAMPDTVKVKTTIQEG